MSEPNASFHTGYVAVVGRPNVGKSTLINALLDQKIAAVSPRPQTTRRRQLGILTLADTQIIFVDTPGVHNPLHKLGEYMNEEALQALDGVDVVLWLVDAAVEPTEEDRLVATHLSGLKKKIPVLLGLNKADRVGLDQRAGRQALFTGLLERALPLWLSAASRAGLGELLEMLRQRLPVGEPIYPEDQVTDLYEREIAVDLIREAALLNLEDEVPHCIAVRIDEYKERPDGLDYVNATILVERESHKGIVIGKGGEMIKRIGATARLSIESMTGRHIFLDLHVKLNKGWRDNPGALKWLGYR